MKFIERNEYLDWLTRWKDQQIIKVVSGVRRCGKSTMFKIFKEYLLSVGVKDSQIITINFEDLGFEPLTDYMELHRYILSHLHEDCMNYIFLDEIQHVDQFEKAVDSLFLRENCDVYITGSNAYFMSGELATRLTGRYVQLQMLPLSFMEYCSGLDGNGTQMTDTERFMQYLEEGGFPYTLRYGSSPQETRDYLRDIYNSILFKDIVARLKVSDVNTLENVTKFMLHNIGNRTSANKIANTLKSAGTSVDQKTVDKYLRGLTDSLLLYSVPRYNLKGRQFLTNRSKYYAVDTGMRNALVRGKDSDAGHILENIIYLELKRRGYDVYVGESDEGEVDFVVENGGRMEYYQVSATVLEEKTLKRELAPLRKIDDNYPKYLLTLDEMFREADYDGIQKRNAVDWLLKKQG